MKSIISCLFALFFAVHLWAYPIDPHPLRMLVEESQYIIVGYVSRIDPYHAEGDTWNNQKAIIEVKEVLQGRLKKKTIEVPFSGDFSCPAPAHYEAGTLVLAFLYKEEDLYLTFALSYGAKTLKEEEIEAYKRRIKEMQKIQKITDENEKFIQTLDWLVACAEHPVTRWEGTFELSPESDFMSFYRRGEPQNFGSALNAKQKERLKAALFADAKNTTIEYVDFGLIDLVHDAYAEEVDKLLIKNLKSVSKEQFGYTEDYMKRLLHRTDDPRADKIAEEFEDVYFQDFVLGDKPTKIETLQNLIKEFVAMVE